ncbi:MAG TPA: hypothetical protein VMF91_13310 [Bryobacteraceae bacterium]|nr:hypothetical protein [Bryobacteraceae bacterium]
MKNFLSGADYHVLSANSSDEAMELCRNYEGAIHLLVADVEQASPSGWDLAQTAARIRPGLIVLFLSKDAVERGEMPRGREEPFHPQVLLQVTQALARKAQQSKRCN